MNSDCSITFVTVTREASSLTPEAVALTSTAPSSASSVAEVAETTSTVESSSVAATTSAAAQSQADANPTTPVPVSRAGGVLQPSAAAESNPRDNTATRAFSSVSIKDASGQCLFIDPTAGDFRENLIPVQLQACTGSAGEKFDFITAGVHVSFDLPEGLDNANKFDRTMPRIPPSWCRALLKGASTLIPEEQLGIL